MMSRTWRRFVHIATAPPTQSPHTTGRPWRIGVVGSGPAGFYTAYRVLKNVQACQVDVLEAMPVPYGLVRYGVAPDHPEVKAVQHKFDAVAADPRFSFVGNVRLGDGEALSVERLARQFDILVLAYGAAKDRLLNIPGESSLRNVLSARDFVGWYNAQPAQRHLQPDLERGPSAVVIGQGNVALDVARVLLSPVAGSLATTDMAEHALKSLRNSHIRHVHVVGRRGPLQVAFSVKELREMLQLPGVRLDFDRKQLLEHCATYRQQLDRDRAKKRLVQLLLDYVPPAASDVTRTWSLDFLQSPVEILGGGDGAVSAVRFERNRLDDANSDGQVQAVGTGQFVEHKASLVLRSIGYRSTAVPGLPFDTRLGVVPNQQGRVLQSDQPGAPIVKGMYVAGWLKRGPTGVIATTMYDAFQTADCIIADIADHNNPLRSDGTVLTREQFVEGLRQSGHRPTSFDDWKRVEAEERRRGAELGKPQEKFASIADMLRFIDGARHHK